MAAEREKETERTDNGRKEEVYFENVNLTVPDEFKSDYLAVILENHECIGWHKFDLGWTETLLQKILLKSEEPVYVKQFHMPDDHHEEVENMSMNG